jgi:hypothetical protein
MHVRGRINRVAYLAKFGEHLNRIATGQQGPVIPTRYALGEYLDVGIEPDRERLVKDKRPGLVIDKSTAACRDNLWGTLDEARNHSAFTIPEIGLAEFFEYFGDAHSGGALDFFIGIDKIHAQSGSQPLADAGFPHSHHADKHHRPVDRSQIRVDTALLFV